MASMGECGTVAEELLHEREETFRLLVESIRDYAIYMLDTKGCIVSWSSGAQSIKGYRAEEILGEHFSIFYSKDDALSGKPERELRVTETDGCFEDEGWRVRKDGSMFWANVTFTALRNEAGELRGFAKVTRDRSERKQAEDALRRSEEKLASILNSIADAILMIDEKLEIVWGNYVATELFGEDLSGKECHAVFGTCGKLCELCSIQKCFMDGRSHEQEIEITGCDGHRRHLWCTANLAERHDSGRPKKIVLVGHDVTEKKSLQAEAMRAGHLAALGELAAGVAHEINNPVNSIINYAQLLADVGERPEISQKIVKEGERIASIVRSLLSFAREREEERSPIHVRDILHDALDLARSQVEKDGITLEVDIPPKIPLINAQGQQIQQVFLNLLSNARYALKIKPGSGEEKLLVIKAELVELEGKRYVRTIFHDRGIGIASCIQDRICDPFFTTKPVGEGTGLGLSVSHGIIHNHGGHLSFESTEGEYTKVVVDLPLGGH